MQVQGVHQQIKQVSVLIGIPLQQKSTWKNIIAVMKNERDLRKGSDESNENRSDPRIVLKIEAEGFVDRWKWG